MKQKNRFVFDMLDQDAPEAQSESIFRSGTPTAIHQEDFSAIIEIPFFKQELRNLFLHPSVPSEIGRAHV